MSGAIGEADGEDIGLRCSCSWLLFPTLLTHLTAAAALAVEEGSDFLAAMVAGHCFTSAPSNAL